ncbi:MAG: 30S ribosomal protein S9 [Solirubrobacterales bacterium]|nr:30S ribosomal protein S9 [Solirubrobacterales bacterium]
MTEEAKTPENEAAPVEEAPAEEATAEETAEAAPEVVRTKETTEVVEEAPVPNPVLALAADARYTATGKRKTAVARVILKPGTGVITVNGRELNEYFPRPTLQMTAKESLEKVNSVDKVDVIAKVHGGGVAAQAGAVRHGIARALLEANADLRGELKRAGFLTRDARVKERKKAGLKKARKRPQFSKR